MVVHSRRERDKDGSGTHRGNLGHGAGTGAADYQVSIGKGVGCVVDERGQRGLHAGGGVVGSQFVDLFFTGLVRDHRALRLGNQRQGLRYHGIERARAQAATDHQHLERARATGKALLRCELGQEFRAQGIAYPLSFGEHLGERGEYAISHTRQYLVGHASHRVLLMQHQRLTQQHRHQPAGEGDVAPQTHHHLRAHPAHHLEALPEGLEQAQRQQNQRAEALATYAGKIHRFERKAARRHQPAFHTGWGTEPVHAPALVTQRLRHRQPREDMSAGAAGHDQCTRLGTHARPPCIICRFSKSMRSTTAMAIMLSRMAEPP